MRSLIVLLLLLTGCEQGPLPGHERMSGLPFSRERTYNDDTPVDPNDLNAMQDSIIGKYVRTVHLTIASADIMDNDMLVSGGAAFAGLGREYFGQNIVNIAGTGAGSRVGTWDLTPHLDPGVVLASITYRWGNGSVPDAGGGLEVAVGHFDITKVRAVGGTFVQLDAANEDTATGGALADRSASFVLNHTVLANRGYGFTFGFNADACTDLARMGSISLILAAPP